MAVYSSLPIICAVFINFMSLRSRRHGAGGNRSSPNLSDAKEDAVVEKNGITWPNHGTCTLLIAKPSP
jgi:hypothetical protein